MEAVSLDLFIRLLAALILGFLLGLEREMTNKYAGLRTHILVCLGACVFTVLSIYGFPTFALGDNVVVDHSTGIRDTARVAAQIVTGIGFIGAGTVLRNGPIIIGLTTAATLWISAAIGMACGVGMYGVATVATIFSVGVLTIIRVFEKRFIPSSFKRTRRFKVSMYLDYEKIDSIREYMVSAVEHIEEFSAKRLIENPEKAKVTILFELLNKKIINDIYGKLTELAKLDSITLQELND